MLVFNRKKGFLLFIRIERFLLLVSIYLVNGRIVVLWKLID
ncbi:hypothetical protein GCM10010252_78230 [Streptomyces aureoverticillatus]|nr:hypothetical protein GCM10010252_78230 [Streptomyces aureoverticillatus]